MKSSINYRLWQFWKSLKRSPRTGDLTLVQSILTSAEYELFQQLPIPDQNHSIRVLKSLQNQGDENPDLLKAALLHDLGKIKYPLKRWERVFSVLTTRLFPQMVQHWGQGKPIGLRRSLVVIHQHPDWGADLAEQAGSSFNTIWLIRNHELEGPSESSFEMETLLRKLQIADNHN
jgi:hypothetical protein